MITRLLKEIAIWTVIVGAFALLVWTWTGCATIPATQSGTHNQQGAINTNNAGSQWTLFDFSSNEIFGGFMGLSTLMHILSMLDRHKIRRKR